MLIPVGLQAIENGLQSEVSKLAVASYTRTHPDLKRWDCNEGSVFLGNQIENIMRQVGIYTVRVSYWKNSDQRQGWVGDGSARNRAKFKSCTWVPPSQRNQRGYEGLEF